MKTLVVFYSRSGTTKKVALALSDRLKCDVEEVFDAEESGYLGACKNATLKKVTTLKPLSYDPQEFDLVIIGTPVWVWTVSTPIRTYLEMNKEKFKNRVAFFATMRQNGGQRAFQEMERIINKKPIDVLALKADEEYVSKLKNFPVDHG